MSGSDGPPSIVVIGTVAPTSTTLAPWVRAQVHTCPLNTITHSPFTSTVGAPRPGAEMRSAIHANTFAESRETMVYILWKKANLPRYESSPYFGKPLREIPGVSFKAFP